MNLFGGRKKAEEAGPSAPIVIALWHPTGATGATTTAIGLAAALGDYGRTALVDADLRRGSIASYLGLDPAPSLGSAALLSPALGAAIAPGHVQEHRTGLLAIPGVPGPGQPARIHPGSLTALLRRMADPRLRGSFQYVVVDVGCDLVAPDPGGGGPVALAPSGQGAGHRAALAAADLVLVVGSSLPQGITDIMLQYPLLEQTLARGAHHPAVWGVLTLSEASRGAGIEATSVRLARELGLEVATVIADDWAAARYAQQKRTSIVSGKPKSPITAAIWGLAAKVVAEPATYHGEGESAHNDIAEDVASTLLAR